MRLFYGTTVHVMMLRLPWQLSLQFSKFMSRCFHGVNGNNAFVADIDYFNMTKISEIYSIYGWHFSHGVKSNNYLWKDMILQIDCL